MSIYRYFYRYIAFAALLMSCFTQAATPSWSSEKNYPDDEITAIWNSGKSGEFEGVDGVPIRFRIFENTSPATKERDAIVIVNGRTESMAKYRELIYDLRQQGFAVYAYDHRGQGYSGRMQDDPQKGYVKHFDDYVADLNTFVETKVKPDGHQKLFLLTHSMGGAIGALYLTNYAHPFNAAVFSSSMFQINSGPLDAGCGLGVALNSVDNLVGEQSAYIPGGGKYSADEFADNVYTTSEMRYTIFRATFEQEPQLQIGSPTVRWVSEACYGAKRSREETASIAIPVLVLQAGNDRIVTVKGQQIFCEKLAAGGKSRCETGMPVVIDGAEHELFIERDELRNQALSKVIEFYSKAP